MIYTENYQLRKPVIGVDNADVNDLNYNSDRIDAIMHSSQISLADAYDLNSTYNTGDVVMYEFLMYRCLEDNVTGVWNPEKWTRTTAGEESGGGSDLDIYGEASGTAEASFSDGAEASLVKCIVEIEATQSGSGTPSPSNIRPISGHSSVTVTVASTSGGSGDDTTVSLGRTVYGGTLDVTTGELKVTHGRVDLGSLSWITGGSGYSERYQGAISGIKLPPDNQTPFNGLCECYEVAPWGYLNESGHDFFICQNSAINALAIRSTNYASQTDFENAINGKYLVYELATPQTFTLTKEQIQTLLGQNYVSHDGGGTISLVYIKKDSTIIPNPSDAEVPLTGLEISGKDFVITDARIPAPPTTNGAYVLTVTVSGGTPTYSWENA